jgi:DNA-directed RNA polymerase specialized sigma24 family protein
VLEGALASLGREAREVVTLRFTLDLSYAEIAGTLGITEAAARGKVFRALERLRRWLPAEEVGDAV